MKNKIIYYIVFAVLIILMFTSVVGWIGIPIITKTTTIYDQEILSDLWYGSFMVFFACTFVLPDAITVTFDKH